MNRTQVAILTPPGSAAIAVLAVRGPDAWSIVRRYFRPARGSPLHESPPAAGLRFGRFGDAATDEVVLVMRGPQWFEIHCHGGRRIVEWLLGLMKSAGATEIAWSETSMPEFTDARAAALLPFARTVRTASILLDQAHGAYARSVAARDAGAVLRRNAAVGRHLVEPWLVAIAGPPNVGKSTLLNALAGFARSIVSPIPGTTRDAVSVSLAFDGWPVDVIDTAGLRESTDGLESEGIDRARAAIAASDLCLWVVDATARQPVANSELAKLLHKPADEILVIINKCDLIEAPIRDCPESPCISAATGQGLTELAARIATILVPEPPRPGEAVPFTPDQCERWS
jgi:tRNA modification GTPase